MTLDDSKSKATATGNFYNSFAGTKNALALTKEIFSSQDDDDNCGSGSHVGTANGSDSFVRFRTKSALRFVKFSPGSSDKFCDRLHLIVHRKLSQFHCQKTWQ